ncbi:unnamed protein product [Didymodactylos carnosus]|uniref:Uncharacterized protein n=1 Tax=Didymodactylos carnosus TaxID=1234261 RepID=A0A814XGM5_9BILA|nr:unnamed protein product [Didymodactylos carnosus]CAF3980014.1 unnamed protein product [Didymodactylos carnosus]
MPSLHRHKRHPTDPPTLDADKIDILKSTIRNKFCMTEQFFATYYELYIVQTLRTKCSNAKIKKRQAEKVAAL